MSTIRQLLTAELPPYPTDYGADGAAAMLEARHEAEARRAAIHDEIAHARVLARRGQMPESEWQDADDPRLEAWRDTLEDIVVSGFVRFGFVMSRETLRAHDGAIFETVADMWEALEMLAKVSGLERPAPDVKVLNAPV